MRVKIIKCSRASYWYADKIGNEFEVENSNYPDRYKVSNHSTNLIDKTDVIEIPSESTGIKYDDGKPNWSLLDLKATEELVKVLTFGATKYSPYNWQKLENFEERYLAAALRHLTAHQSGEKYDPDSGLLHLAHAECCLHFLIWNELKKEEKNNGS